MIKPDEIMRPSEVSAMLRIHIRTVYNLAEKGELPGIRIGRSWRFNRGEILQLLSNKSGKAPVSRSSPSLKDPTSTR